MSSIVKTPYSEKVIARLPQHLKRFIVPQNYELYSAIDQAVWRFVMRKNMSYLKKIAHKSYIDGLRKAGIGTETIPNIYGMNRILKEIGWAAVAVDGFIPPNAFMEFQANKILVIACDIRQLENIEYTPTPDIIHEASGHAPIIANPDYAEFLRRLGKIGSKAIMSKHDVDLYEAVRKLSMLKEKAEVDKSTIDEAQKVVNKLQKQEQGFSEMAKVRNMQWWSVEYGLIGSMDSPKIYGAGLLSSIGESKWCMGQKVKKVPYSIDVTEVGFDITKPQPQLFVTPNFPYLMEVLEEFANTLSVRKGGHEGLQKLIASESVGTIELNTGLQISGVFSDVILNENKDVIYFKTRGGTALSYRDKELIGHGVSCHKSGYSSPLGMLKKVSLPLEDMTSVDLRAYNIYDGKLLSFEFESGVKVAGINITGIRNLSGKIMIIQLRECTVSYKENILFKPEYGTFDMAIGNDIISAFAGSADPESFIELYNKTCKKISALSEPPSPKVDLELLAQKIRDLRLSKSYDKKTLVGLFKTLKFKHPNNWILPLELLELAKNQDLKVKINKHLQEVGEKNPKLKSLIGDGINLIKTMN